MKYPIKIVFGSAQDVKIPVLCLSIQEAKELTSFIFDSHRITLEFGSSCDRCGFVKSNYNPGTKQYLGGMITELNTGNQISLSRDIMLWLYYNLLSTLEKQPPRMDHSKIPLYVNPADVEQIKKWEVEGRFLEIKKDDNIDPLAGAKRRTDKNLGSIFG